MGRRVGGMGIKKDMYTIPLSLCSKKENRI